MSVVTLFKILVAILVFIIVDPFIKKQLNNAPAYGRLAV